MLSHVVRVLRERWKLLVAVTLVFASVAVLFDLRRGKTFLPTASVEIRSPVRDATVLGLRPPLLNAPIGELARRAADRALSPVVLRAAARRLDLDRPEFSNYALSPEVVGGAGTGGAASGLVRVGVRDEDPARGARVANALARALVKQLRIDAQREISGLIEALQARRDELGPASRDDFGRRLRQIRVERQLIRLRLVREVVSPAAITGLAYPPEEPAIYPGERVRGSLNFGFCLALVAAFVLDAFQRRPRDPRRLTVASGLALAGLIPDFKDAPDSEVTSAFGAMRRSVESRGGPSRPRIVEVTSAVPGEGKTSVAVGLAEAAAAAGRRVCLVECDFRRPALAERLGATTPGLAGLLTGEAGVADAVLELVAPGGGKAIHVIPAGARLARPGEALRSGAADGVLDVLASRYDIVVLDSPPLLPTADARQLVERAGVVVLCARVRHSVPDELRAAAEVLRQMGASCALLAISGVGAADLHTTGAAAARADEVAGVVGERTA